MGKQLLVVSIVVLCCIAFPIGDAQSESTRNSEPTTTPSHSAETSPSTPHVETTSTSSSVATTTTEAMTTSKESESSATTGSMANHTVTYNSTSPRVPFNRLTYPYQVHSCLQMLGWCTFAAIGFFMEVHFPIIFTTRRGMQLKLASGLQFISLILALSAIISLAVMVGWSQMDLHKLLGLLALVMRLLGFITLACKPPKDGSPTKRHIYAGYARIFLTRGSFLLAIATVYTGLNALFGRITVPLWVVVLLSILIVIDIIFELILFLHAHRMRASRGEESKRLLTFSRDPELERSGQSVDNNQYVEPSLTKSPIRVGLTISYIVIAIGVTVLITVRGIYYNPAEHF